ncbi:MAG: DUF4358 domain-containing protein [Oscillospiraceae bacterium]
MKKLCIALCVCMLSLMLVSCSDVKSSFTADEIITAVFEKHTDSRIDSKLNISDDMFKNNCEKLYDTSIENISDGAYAYSENSQYADEISVLKCDNSEDILEKRLEKRKALFSGYSVTEAHKLENAKLFSKDGYAFLIVSDNAEQLQTEIEDYMK